MAKGVHNATSGYRRGKGKNGGGLPGQPSGRNKKQNYATRKGLTVQQRHKRSIAVSNAAGIAGVFVGHQIGKFSDDPNAKNLGRYGGALAGNIAGNIAIKKTGLAINGTEYRKLGKAEKDMIQKRNKKIAQVQLGIFAGAYAYGASKAYRQVTGGLNMNRTRKNAQNFRNAQRYGLPSINIPKRSRNGVYNVTSANRPRRGYR